MEIKHVGELGKDSSRELQKTICTEEMGHVGKIATGVLVES